VQRGQHTHAQATGRVFLISVGVPALIAFFGHPFGGQAAARRLGWPTGNPFQTELGIWDGAAGIVAIAAFWCHGWPMRNPPAKP